MDLYDALDRATETFAARLAEVGDDDWQRPSINPGWSVHYLVSHVVGGNRRYVLLLHGAPTSEVEALRGIAHLGADPQHDFASTAADVIAAFHEPGVLARTVHHRKGDRSGADLLVMRVFEHALHGWDLARSIDADDTIDPDVIDALFTAIAADPTILARSGYPAIEPGDGSDPQQRLLTLTGRANTR